MGYKFFVGWDTVLPSQVPTHLRVTFDRLVVHRAMDPGCSLTAPVPNCSAESTRTNQGTETPGDYNIYWDANGIWGQWPCTGVVCRPDAPGELLPMDGDSYTGTQSVDLYVPPGKGWRLFVHGRECDLNAVDPARPMKDCPTNEELADNNDVQGLILDKYTSAAASLGTHTSNARTANADPTSTCPNVNTTGCYSVTYTVTKVNDEASRARVPDLSIAKTDSPDPVAVGQPLTYTLTANNNGPVNASGVSVVDQLPAGVSFVSAAASQGTCTQTNGTVTCALGNLPSGSHATVTIKVTPQQEGAITNTASISSSDEPDADDSNNSATAETTVVTRADVSVKKSDSPDPAVVGGKLTYTVRVRNSGPQTATGVELTDHLPKSVRWRSVNWSQGNCKVSGSTVTCDLGDLPSGSTATVRIVVKPTQKGRITNTASVTSASPDDPNLANNTASASTRVVADT
jgi:uncharacterized repeat protein (TIGR01451 family)